MAAADFVPLAGYTTLHVLAGGTKPLSQRTLGRRRERELVNLRIFLIAGALLGASCRHVPPRCKYNDFLPRPYDHIAEAVGPFEVKSFHGQVTSKDIVDPWPAQLDGQFEIHGPDGFVVTVPVRQGGVFEYNLRPGAYCFKLSALGFRSTTGTVTVSPRASEQAIIISMKMAV